MAINFAGGTDGIQYGPNGWDAATGCIYFRLKTTQTTVNAAPVTLWGNSSRNGLGFVLNNTPDKIRMTGSDATTTQITLVSTTSLNDGNWHDVALNWNVNSGGANTLFIDGAAEATANSAAAWAIAGIGAPLCLADSNDTFWPSYVGDMAEVAVWFNRQLSADEIAALAKGLSPSKLQQGLVFHAPLIRSPNNRFNSFVSIIGTTVSVHPRVIYPVFA